MLHTKIWRGIKFPIVTSLHGFATCIKAGERTQRSIVNLSESLPHVSKENVRCVMEYTVNLTVILDDIFRSGADHVSSTHDIKVVMDKHTKSGGRRDMIHSDIHNFFKVMTFASRLKRDLVLDKIIELIWKYCPLVPS